MATISREYVDAFNAQLDGVSEHAKMMLADQLAGIDAGDYERIARIMRLRLSPYTKMSEALACRFYDGIRQAAGAPGDYHAELPEDDGGAKVYRDSYAVARETVAAGAGAQMAERMGDLAQREIGEAANNAVAHNTRRDPAKPKCASVPTAANPCEWCRMRASAGFIYDQDSDSHNNCKCRLVPGFKGSAKVEGYDPAPYREEWDAAAEAYRSGDIDEDLKEKIAEAKARHNSDPNSTKPWDDTNAILMVMRRM